MGSADDALTDRAQNEHRQVDEPADAAYQVIDNLLIARVGIFTSCLNRVTQ